MRAHLTLLAVISIALAVACGDDGEGVEGSGDVITETEIVSEFDEVQADNGVIVVLNVDPDASGDIELEISSDANLLQYMRVEVADGTLLATVDGPSGGARSTAGFRVAATTATLEAISVNNGAEVEASGLNADLRLGADNGGIANVVGAGPTLELDVDNGAVVDADRFEVATVTVGADNGAVVAVCGSSSLHGNVTNGAVLTNACGGNTADVETSNGGLVN